MQAIIEKAKKIKCVIFDVDGVLTNGQLYFSDKGVELKAFHVHDGQGIKLLLEHKIEVAIITHHNSPIVTCRMEELGIRHIYLGETPKIHTYKALLEKLSLKDEEVAYVGDDIGDLAVIRRAGLSIAVANASRQLMPHAHWKTNARGGEGAAREVCDLILEAHNLNEKILEKYGS